MGASLKHLLTSNFSQLSAVFGWLKSSVRWSGKCIGYGGLFLRSIESGEPCSIAAGVPELVKGAGLKLRCLALRGFKSHPLHQLKLTIQ